MVVKVKKDSVASVSFVLLTPLETHDHRSVPWVDRLQGLKECFGFINAVNGLEGVLE